uniref:Peptide chain release factor domain-containing protein n=1 Tax=Ditylenchus dipsaci TaxID=166011 RepID=A0A915E7H7_9BILA
MVLCVSSRNLLRHLRVLAQQFKGISSITELDSLSRCQMEFNSGAGGVEAMLFAGELMHMYQKFAHRHGFSWQQIQVDTVALGGIRSAIIGVGGPSCYALLKFEAGVHRVQRVPITDKTRVHTSTASVAVLPEPENPELHLPKNDIKMETMRASGPGGQNVNQRSTACRMVHIPSGTVVKCMEERTQLQNINIAYRRLASILLQRLVDAAESKFSSSRKLQVSTLARAAKIRTYNFKDNRITDHRIKFTTNKMQDFMNGGETLDEMIDMLQEEHLIESMVEEQNKALEKSQVKK